MESYIQTLKLTGAFKRICKNAGIKLVDDKTKKSGKANDLKLSNVNIHMLRHTFATRCLEADVSITVLQKLLGHSNIQTTINIYGDVYDYYRQKEIRKYDIYMEEIEEKFNLEMKENKKKSVI